MPITPRSASDAGLDDRPRENPKMVGGARRRDCRHSPSTAIWSIWQRMSSSSVRPNQHTSFFDALAIQMRVIGALMMRELHTRYGRENVGYLWLIGEPLMLGSVIATLHSGGTEHGSDMNPVAFSSVGYTIFIMFRGIVNRSEGAIEANSPLLFHKMVTVLDITIARALLEAAGTFLAFTVLFSFCLLFGFAEFPPRPLALFAGIGLVFWLSLAMSMVITGATHDNRLLERLVHPFTYFMIPLSGAFYRVAWVPQPYRYYLLFNPFPEIFELIRYGAFESGTLEFFYPEYVVAVCTVVTVLGLIAVRAVRARIHLH
jgi:capsular polysaccharide transport system permease protein